MPDRPNILLILADQMIPHLSGAYGHPVVKTPNLNQLVEDGIRSVVAQGAFFAADNRQICCRVCTMPVR